MRTDTLLDPGTLPDDHPALVPDLWVRAMLDMPEVTPEIGASALVAAGLAPALPMDGPLKLTQAHESVIMHHLAETLEDAAFGARAGISHDPKRGTILTYMIFASATLGDMLDLVTRYIPITRSRSHLDVTLNADQVIVRLDFDDVMLSENPQYGDFSIGSILKTLRLARGGDVPVDWVSVATPARLPPGVLEQIFGCPVRDDRRDYAVCLPRKDLELAIPSADDALLTHLTGYGDILLERREVHGRSGLAEVERLIRARLSFGAPGLPDIAKQMGLSPRTLSRHLDREGQSFRDVLERLRYDMARRYLADLDLPLAEVAFLLGFADQSGFGTAFRRWSGYTPGQYRKTL